MRKGLACRRPPGGSHPRPDKVGREGLRKGKAHARRFHNVAQKRGDPGEWGGAAICRGAARHRRKLRGIGRDGVWRPWPNEAGRRCAEISARMALAASSARRL